MVALRLKTVGDELLLVDLPWDRPLADWPAELSVKRPEGLHRHDGLRDRVVDALVVLLARLHIAGFFWG